MLYDTSSLIFLSTLSLRRATHAEIHASTQQEFLSTLSLRRATALGLLGWLRVLISIHALLAESDPGKVKVVEPGFVFLSTLSLRRATSLWAWTGGSNYISIHALLAESDASCQHRSHQECSDFYPRSPCGERHFRSSIKCAICNFYPRSPCGERHFPAS